MKLLILSVLVACALGMTQPRPDLDAEWREWKLEHGRDYVVEEESKRRDVWLQNRNVVMKHNYEYDLGKHTYRLGMNKFADVTGDEFKAMYLSQMKPSPNGRDCKPQSLYYMPTLPAEVDWKSKGYVTPVKNQMQCGSCWAFSTTGSVEGQHFKSTGKLVSLSEQNLVDCSGPEGDEACNGGIMDFAFEYIIKTPGIDTEASYPYEAVKGTCRFNPANVGATISSCVDVTSMNENALQKAVADVGPISVAIDASHISFQLYKDGVYNEPACSQTLLDHGVLAVGYGSDKGGDYWMVKNSWGAEWGMEGYIKMSRNRNNNCGIATNASYPIV